MTGLSFNERLAVMLIRVTPDNDNWGYPYRRSPSRTMYGTRDTANYLVHSDDLSGQPRMNVMNRGMTEGNRESRDPWEEEWGFLKNI